MQEEKMALVLVMGPDPETWTSLIPLLEAAGCRGVSCSATSPWRPSLQRLHPDVVILSKETENCEAMIRVGRIKEKYPEMRVLLCVEAEDWPSPLDASDAGADGFHRKGSGAEVLLESIRRLVGSLEGQRLALWAH
jgi:DNA-binding NarL/FixJ family response regulator